MAHTLRLSAITYQKLKPRFPTIDRYDRVNMLKVYSTSLKLGRFQDIKKATGSVD